MGYQNGSRLLEMAGGQYLSVPCVPLELSGLREGFGAARLRDISSGGVLVVLSLEPIELALSFFPFLCFL